MIVRESFDGPSVALAIGRACVALRDLQGERESRWQALHGLLVVAQTSALAGDRAALTAALEAAASAEHALTGEADLVCGILDVLELCYFVAYERRPGLEQEWLERLALEEAENPHAIETVTDVCATLGVGAELRDANGTVVGTVDREGNVRLASSDNEN